MHSLPHDESLVELQATVHSQSLDAASSETADAQRLEAARRRRNLLLGLPALGMAIAGYVGFIPAYWVNLTEGHWYFDAISRANFPDVLVAEERWGDLWHLSITIHATTCLVWTVLAVSQVLTGATGVPGDARKAWHRRVGKFAVGVGVLVSMQAVFLQLLKPWNAQYIEIMTVPVMTFYNIYTGVVHARNKRYSEHKSAMTWTLIWAGAPGVIRLFHYLMMHLSGWQCRIEQLGFITWVGAAFTGLLALPPYAWLGELKTRPFIVNVSGIGVALCGSAFAAYQVIRNDDWCWP